MKTIYSVVSGGEEHWEPTTVMAFFFDREIAEKYLEVMNAPPPRPAFYRLEVNEVAESFEEAVLFMDGMSSKLEKPNPRRSFADWEKKAS